MSNCGKSFITAGLCRIFRQEGLRVAPFKSQNMALNSHITDEGLEIGRAQAVQAEAAGVPPSALMNPILLKPTTDTGSQVIVNGISRGNMSAVEYFKRKHELVGDVKKAFWALSETVDAVVIEGAGSPAEINLSENDFVNMGMARIAGSPVLLVGDIERGGVFAQLAGTLMLLKEDSAIVKGLVVNKFRGDLSIFEPGAAMLADVCRKPVVGVVPFLGVDIDDEDSLTERFAAKREGLVDVAVIRLPKISNFTDFAPLEATPGIRLRYEKDPKKLGNPELIVIPGTKSTIADLRLLRESGLEAAILKAHANGAFVFGICGGYQMMGLSVKDPEFAEGGGCERGMGLLPVHTVFLPEKTRLRCKGEAVGVPGFLSPSGPCFVEGYEMHMGATFAEGEQNPLALLEGGKPDGHAGVGAAGTYLHGFFDSSECRKALFAALCEKAGVKGELDAFDYSAYRQEQFDKLAEGLRSSLDMDLIHRILEGGINA
jgi:adenosylcobyric acid synthase